MNSHRIFFAAAMLFWLWPYQAATAGSLESGPGQGSHALGVAVTPRNFPDFSSDDVGLEEFDASLNTVGLLTRQGQRKRAFAEFQRLHESVRQ